jgi:hypothetical protein
MQRFSRNLSRIALGLAALALVPQAAVAQRCAEQLGQDAPAILDELGALTRRAGRAWHADYGALESVAFEGELCAAYA